MTDVYIDHEPQNQQLLKTIEKNIIETKFDPSHLHHQETVFILSNGYLGTRGTFEEGYPDDRTATLINGVYDDVAKASTELVNCPDWLPLEVTVAGDRFSMDSGEILNYERRLNLCLGIVSRDVRWRSPKGHTLDLHFERFTSLADQHVMAIRCQITSINFAGEITVVTGFDAKPNTQGVPHWRTLNYGGIDQIIWLQNQTLHSGILLGMAAKLVVEGDDTAIVRVEKADCPALTTNLQVFPANTVTVEKIVTVFTSQEAEIPIAEALQRLADEPRYSTLLAAHIASSEQVWLDGGTIIKGDRQAQLKIRDNLLQLLAVAPGHDNQEQ
ncbi:glycoside hydrolase family 65 protein [Nostoc sp. UHCC 0702]|nr:glycoside hydrolase family 65 protein [Nostoc sp. UHCC 0702]